MTSSWTGPFHGMRRGRTAASSRWPARPSCRGRTRTSSVGSARGTVTRTGRLNDARIADGAGRHGVGERLGRGDHERRRAGDARAGIGRAHARSRRAAEGRSRSVTTRRSGSTMRAPVATRSTRAPGLRQHLEHLARGRRDQEVEARRDALRLEQRRGGEHVAQGGAGVAAEDDLRDRLAREIADRAHRAGLVHEQRIDRREVDRRSTSSQGAPGSGMRARWALERR